MVAMMTPVLPGWLSTLYKLWNSVLDVWNGLWSVLGPVGNLLQWLFHSNENFYLFVKRQQFWLLNKTTWWNASFRFEVPEDKLETLPDLVASVASSLKDEESFEVFRDLAEHKTVRAGGIIFDFDGSADFFHVQISDQKISFRDSRRLIELQLFPLLEAIEESLGECERQYSLTAKFGSQENPYFSTYVRRLNNRLILSFDCKYRLGDSPGSAMVSVNMDSVSVIAGSREQFRFASLRVLGLSSP